MAIDLKTEIVNLRRGLLAMGAATEQRLDFAVRALLEQDVAAAAAVKAGDNEIDAMEVDLETQCMKVLALGAPVAHDLRFVLSVVRISADFERIA
ncbi:MAG: phosphate signaling complex PhoU family protein, partial [Phycisphaerales bacterium]